MSRHHAHLNTAIALIGNYAGKLPLHHYLKQHFSHHKKYGSSDRKAISQLCYGYFRLGQLAQKMPVEQAVLLGDYFLQTQPIPRLVALQPDRAATITLPISEKFSLLNIPAQAGMLHPSFHQLSDLLDDTGFFYSFFNQPKVFARIRPGRTHQVLQALQGQPFIYDETTASISFDAGFNIEPLIQLNRDLVIQDRSSQQIFNWLRFQPDLIQKLSSKNISVWDACAASGGKSILLYDLLNGRIKLTVTDIRESILSNLKQRFLQAGLNCQYAYSADLSHPVPAPPAAPFDMILCDVPCSGSGTWARTPEAMYYTTEAMITRYAQLQLQIARNAWPHLAPGGLFFYITCSVLREENEMNTEQFSRLPDCSCLSQTMIPGYAEQADSLFVAVFTKQG